MNLYPAAEVTQVDLYADHQGPVEAMRFLPVGTLLYTAEDLARVKEDIAQWLEGQGQPGYAHEVRHR